MSRENVEVMRSAIEALNERDIDRWLDWWHPDGEWYPRGAGRLEGKQHRGHQQLRHFVENYFASWGVFRIEEEDILDLGDRVVFVGRIHIRGRTSGVELDRPWGCVFRFRDGRIGRADGYTHPREALEAAGLRE